MRFNSALVLYSALFAASIVSATGSDGCNRNNCLRAIIATRDPDRHGSADCQSYFQTTIETKTTVTKVNYQYTKITYVVTTIPTDIPAYASACSGGVKYSSACSCVGATPVTIDITPTCGPGKKKCGYEGKCRNILSDPWNCGDCGKKCNSGKCVNGQCVVKGCNGSSCGSLNRCGDGCFCFKEASGDGFCGPNVPCGPLKGCNKNHDCKQGEVCAVSTCCKRKVCLGSCKNSPYRRSFGVDVVVRDDDEGWTGGSEA